MTVTNLACDECKNVIKDKNYYNILRNRIGFFIYNKHQEFIKNTESGEFFELCGITCLSKFLSIQLSTQETIQMVGEDENNYLTKL